jgi:hypothetical protein
MTSSTPAPAPETPRASSSGFGSILVGVVIRKTTKLLIWLILPWDVFKPLETLENLFQGISRGSRGSRDEFISEGVLKALGKFHLNSCCWHFFQVHSRCPRASHGPSRFRSISWDKMFKFAQEHHHTCQADSEVSFGTSSTKSWTPIQISHTSQHVILGQSNTSLSQLRREKNSWIPFLCRIHWYLGLMILTTTGVQKK